MSVGISLLRAGYFCFSSSLTASSWSGATPGLLMRSAAREIWNLASRRSTCCFFFSFFCSSVSSSWGCCLACSSLRMARSRTQ